LLLLFVARLAKLALWINQWQEMLLVVWLSMLRLSCNLNKLSSFLFFDLFQRFQEKLFNIASLIKNHLAECFQVLDLSGLQSYAFS
jgi:hypothetical protein